MNKYLTNKCLIAPPKMQDWRFGRSVIYIWKHDLSGAGGIIVNKKVSAPSFSNICEEGKIKRLSSVNPQIFYGGPVMTNIVGCLHSLDYKIVTTHFSNNNIGFTLDKKIIEDIALGKGPKRYLLTMGISSWQAGQLEDEIQSVPPRSKNSSWLHLDSTYDMIFGPKLATLWQDCLMQCVSNTTKNLTNKVFKN